MFLTFKIMLDNGIIGAFVVSYFCMLLILVTALINVYSVDEIYFQNNFYSKYFTFKHKMFFICQFDKKNKNIVAQRTFFMEIICYLLFAINIGLCIVSLFLTSFSAFIVLGIDVVLTMIYATITGGMLVKAKKKLTSNKR